MSEQIPELHEDPALAELLRATGPRVAPPPAVEAEVRAAVETEWQRVVAGRVAARRRQARSRLAGALALAASVAGVALLVFREPVEDPGAGPVLAGTLTRVTGAVAVAAASGEAQRAATAGVPLTGESRLTTGPAGRAVVALAGGGSLRVDAGTRLVFASADNVVLDEGAVYFDSQSEGSQARPFVVTTRRGAVRHVGTQFMVRATRQAGPVSVSVREGRVLVEHDGARREAAAGDRVTLLADGSAEVGRIAPDAAEWQWIHAVTPPYQLEGRPLDEFLSWAARETGRRLEFASAADREAAAAVRLSGSIDGFTPDDALAAVVPTTRFSYRLEDGRLAVAHQR
jgi:ferric-dicitrate binding protein FerR (iron transport regulator)